MLCLAAADILLQRLADLGRAILGTHEDKERIVAGKRADNPIPLLGGKHFAGVVGHAGEALDQHQMPGVVDLED